MSRAYLLFFTPALALLVAASGCFFDASGIGPPGLDAAADQQPKTDRGVPVDGPADGPVRYDGDLSAKDGAPAETKPPLDAKPPPDAKTATDTTPPCAGMTCPLGCQVALNRCRRLQPSNFKANGLFDKVTKGLTTAGAMQINTDTGEIKFGSNVPRPAGSPGTALKGIYWQTQAQPTGYPQLSIFGVDSLTIPQGTSLLVSGSRALAIYARGPISIQGTLAAAATSKGAASGGKAGGAPASNGQPCFGGEGKTGTHKTCSSPYSSYTCKTSGGGGGGGAAGGSGGDSTGSGILGGAGGKAVGNAKLVPLLGGCGGAGSGHCGGAGGGGGGAIQLSANGTISVTGGIHVGGGGGGGSGYTQLSGYCGGGGGGAGGSVLLEGISVMVSGLVAANGGSGGGGGLGGGGGVPGEPSTTSAPGGGTGSYGTGGGSGGALSTPKGGGVPAYKYHTGAGGGAAGRIRINAKTISAPAGKTSPARTTSTSIATW